MSLVSNILDLATRIGQEIKAVRTEMSSLSGGGIASQATLDFGSQGVKYKLFTINDANLTSGKKVTNIVYVPKLNKVANIVKESIDDDEFDSIDFSLRDVSIGSFQILARSNGIINNYKTIQYTIQ